MRSAAPASQNRGRDEYTGFYLIFIVVGFGLLLWVCWINYHTEISAAAMAAAHWQMVVIHEFTDRFDQADQQVLSAHPGAVTFWQMVRLMREIGRFFLYPAMGLLFVLAGICLYRAAPSRFTGALDLEALVAEQAKSFRCTAAFVGRRLGLTEIREGAPRPADSALGVGEWLAVWAPGDGVSFEGAEARAELVRQLGDAWIEVSSAAPHVRCMMAAIGLHLARRRAEAAAFLGDLSTSLSAATGEERCGPETPLAFPPHLVAAADRVLNDKDVSKPLLAVMKRHFFTTPALMSALTEARLKAGVLAPAEFAWLKLVDRRLWYALHSLGFEVEGSKTHAHPCQRVEAIGARDHWAAERLAGRPLAAPAIDRAVEAIRAARNTANRQAPKLVLPPPDKQPV